MKINIKFILMNMTLCMILAFVSINAMASETDTKQILSTTQAYIKATSTAGKYKLEIFKQTKKWAIVSVIPVPEGSYEGAGVVLEKVDNKWIVRDMGTDLSEYDSKFK